MWRFKILAVSWLCVVWTKVGFATEDTSTGKLESTVAPTGGEPHFGEFDLESTKPYSADSTVRSFFPVKGKQKWMRRGYPPVEEMLFFNLSIVNDNEEVSLAELHLHRRRIAKIHGSYHKRFLPLPYRVVLYQVQPNSGHKISRDARTMKLASLPVSYTTKSGWHTLDVTAVVRELLINAQGGVELLLGIQFEAPRGVPKTYTPLVPLKHFLKPAGSSEPNNPYKTSSYLVVFSDIDPYFDEFDEANPPENPETDNEIPDGHLFKERHLKHKIFKVNSNDVLPEKKTKDVKKYKGMENEVYKAEYGRGKEDVVRHKNKHRITEVKRSKADEMALQQKNNLKTLPFLHTNEVEEIRQTSRRLTRSVDGGSGAGAARNSITGDTGNTPKPKDVRRILNHLIKEAAADSARNGSTAASECSDSLLTITLEKASFGAKLASPDSFTTMLCSGPCSSAESAAEMRCRPGSRRALELGFYDKTGRVSFLRLDDFLATDCRCR